MMGQLLNCYLAVALFTLLSILYEWPTTGSKSDYTHLKMKLHEVAKNSLRWFIFGYLFVLACGSLFWPYTYYCRVRDVWRAR